MAGRSSCGGWCGCPAGKTRTPGISHRELEGLKRERTRQRNRIHGILMQQGLCVPNPSKKRFRKDLEALRTWDGQKLPVGLKARLVRVHQQLRLMEDQISALAPEKREQLKEVDNAKMRQVAQLLRLPGIGPVSSWTFVMEFFGWRQFRKRQEVAALAGLTPTPLRQWQTVLRAGD